MMRPSLFIPISGNEEDDWQGQNDARNARSGGQGRDPLEEDDPRAEALLGMNRRESGWSTLELPLVQRLLYPERFQARAAKASYQPPRAAIGRSDGMTAGGMTAGATSGPASGGWGLLSGMHFANRTEDPLSDRSGLEERYPAPSDNKEQGPGGGSWRSPAGSRTVQLHTLAAVRTPGADSHDAGRGAAGAGEGSRSGGREAMRDVTVGAVRAAAAAAGSGAAPRPGAGGEGTRKGGDAGPGATRKPAPDVDGTRKGGPDGGVPRKPVPEADGTRKGGTEGGVPRKPVPDADGFKRNNAGSSGSAWRPASEAGGGGAGGDGAGGGGSWKPGPGAGGNRNSPAGYSGANQQDGAGFEWADGRWRGQVRSDGGQVPTPAAAGGTPKPSWREHPWTGMAVRVGLVVLGGMAVVGYFFLTGWLEAR